MKGAEVVVGDHVVVATVVVVETILKKIQNIILNDFCFDSTLLTLTRSCAVGDALQRLRVKDGRSRAALKFTHVIFR